MNIRISFIIFSLCGTSHGLQTIYRHKAESFSNLRQEKNPSSNNCPYHPEPLPLSDAEYKTKINPLMDWISQYVSGLVNDIALPAISANIVYRNKIIWEGNYGQLSKTNKTVPTGDTIYRIASISKIFPTIFLFKLWEQGLLDLHDDVTKYAPHFDIGRPYNSRTNISLHDIASQISGIPEFLPFDLLKRDFFQWNGTLEETLDIIRTQILVAEPRTTCYYSNVAYALLAHVLERNFTASGSFEKWAELNIVQKLNLKNTGFTLTDSVKEMMARGYYPSGAEAPLMDINWLRPAGNYYSTARDLSEITMSLMETSDLKILNHETLVEMLRPVSKCGYGYLAEVTGSPWEINEQHTYLVIRKDGAMDGYSSAMAMVPDLDLSFNILMSGSRPEDVAFTVFDKMIPVFTDVLRSKPQPIEPAIQPSKYVGLYHIENVQFWNVTASSNNTLTMTNPNIPDSPFKTIGLSYVNDGVVKLTILGGLFPCVVGEANLEIQNDQLVHFSHLKNGQYNQFDMPGLNIYGFIRK